MDRELLLEIGTEEIPASWLPGLTTQIGKVLEAKLKEARLAIDEPIETFSTPRRLTVRVGADRRAADRSRRAGHRAAGVGGIWRGRQAHAGRRRLREEAGRGRRSDRAHHDAEGRIHRRAQAPARQGRGRRAARGAHRRAARHGVPEADAMGRRRSTTARASCRLAVRFAGSCICSAGRVVPFTIGRSPLAQRLARAGDQRRRVNLWTSLPDHERAGRAAP